MKGCASLHLQGLTLIVGEHKSGNMIGRLIAPPPSPTLIWPRAADRPEHISPEYPCSIARRSFNRETIVDAGLAAPFLAVHGLKGSGRKEPFEDLRAVYAQRIIQILICSCGKAVE